MRFRFFFFFSDALKRDSVRGKRFEGSVLAGFFSGRNY